MQTFIVNSSLFMHCTALHWWFAPSIVMWLASAETFSPCAACALHYGCVFVCLCYWLPSPALLCNAKLIWPVVFLSGKSLHFSCNPSQWRSYWELSTAPPEQCAHMKWIGCVCCSEQHDRWWLGSSTHQPNQVRLCTGRGTSTEAPFCCPLSTSVFVFFHTLPSLQLGI